MPKLLHPDVILNQTDEQKALWNRVAEAYEIANLEMLRVLHELALNAKLVEILGSGKNVIVELKGKIDFLKQKMRELILEIEKIKQVFPFNTVKILEDKDFIEKKKSEISVSIKEGKLVLEELEKHLLMLTPSAGTFLN